MRYLLLLLLFPFILFAQSKIDTLERSLPNLKNEERMSALVTLGQHYIKQDPDKAFEYASEALKLGQAKKNKKIVADSYSILGKILKNRGDYSQALQYHLKALKTKEELNDTMSIAVTLNDIGVTYKNMRQFDQALPFYKKSLLYSQSINYTKGIVNGLNNVGTIYLEKFLFDSARSYFQESYNISKEKGDINSLANATSNLAQLSITIKDFEQALKYLNQSLQYDIQTKNDYGRILTLINISAVKTEQGKNVEAKQYVDQALELSRTLQAKPLIRNCYAQLARIYENLNDCNSALKYSKMLYSIHDSIVNEESSKQVAEMHEKYQLEKKEQQIRLQKTEIQHKQEQVKRQQTQQNALIIGFLLMIALTGVTFRSYRIKQKANQIITKQKREVEFQKHIVEEKQKEILDSINYAKRIQAAVLPPERIVKEHLPDSFIVYIPKDIVAGDFYWLESRDGTTLFAAADCTGHGVPGAMVSVICNNGLNRSVREYGLTDPGKILDKAREIVIQEFEKSEEEVKDGMDISLCSLSNYKLLWAGANNPLWIIRKGSSSIDEHKADKQPIGRYAEEKPFTTHQIVLQPGDIIYVFTDGFADQFGGANGKKFKYSKLKELLVSIKDESMDVQKQTILENFEQWKGKLDQVDDVCIIGVRV